MLNTLGRRITRAIHGNKRNDSNCLIVGDYYLWSDQERNLGLSYLGLLGIPLFVLFGILTMRFYEPSGATRHYFVSRWSEVEILTMLAVICHLTGMASAFACIINWKMIKTQPTSEL
jgi:hypothetical protein